MVFCIGFRLLYIYRWTGIDVVRVNVRIVIHRIFLRRAQPIARSSIYLDSNHERSQFLYWSAGTLRTYWNRLPQQRSPIYPNLGRVHPLSTNYCGLCQFVCTFLSAPFVCFLVFYIVHITYIHCARLFFLETRTVPPAGDDKEGRGLAPPVKGFGAYAQRRSPQDKKNSLTFGRNR